MNAKNLLLLHIIIIIVTSAISFAQEFHGTTSTPVYTGGFSALKEFIAQNISSPKISGREELAGVVTLSYTVNEKGKVVNIKILRGIDAKCDSEAVRAAQRLPGWRPAIQWGKPVSASIVMPVEFYCEKSNPIEGSIMVSGIVSDKSTGKPIEGALILVKGTSIGAITDKTGMFSLSAPGEENELEFSSMGYETKSEAIGKNRTINSELFTGHLIIDFTTNQFR